MAAADELPRGVTLGSNPGVNGQASVTFPAIPGLAWVLTAVNWYAWALGETLNQQAVVEVLSGSNTLVLDSAILIPDTNLQKDSGSWQGQYPGPASNALEVAFSSGLSGGSEILTATAYPI